MNIEFGRNLLAGVAFPLLLSGAAAGQSLTMKVNSTSDQPDQYAGDGVCQTLYGTCTLRAAIDEANAKASAGPHMIQIGAGTYTLVGTVRDDYNQSGDLDIQSNVTIVGAGAATTILQGGGLDRVVDVLTGATVTIVGVTITGGIMNDPATGGGGIRNAGTLTLRNCAVQSNFAGTTASNDGGGIYNKALNPTDPLPTLNLDHTTVSGNYAYHGGGIYNGGALNIADSAISGNGNYIFGNGIKLQTALGGGVIDSRSGSTTVTRSTIDRNKATWGGGLYMTGALTMSNCTVSGNEASHGGALWLASNATIGSCTFHGNVKLANSFAVEVNSGTVSVRATIFDESSMNNYDIACKRNSGIIVSEGYNIDRGFSCPFGTTDWSKTDAKLDPNLAYNGGPTQTHALLAGSQAIGAIPYVVAKSADFVPSTDQRGVGRPQVRPNTVFAYTSCVVDIGAFEYVYPALPTLPLYTAGAPLMRCFMNEDLYQR